jgi:hypothetical protein
MGGLDALSWFADNNWQQKRHTEARVLHERAMQVTRKALGSEHEQVGRPVSSLG